ncbi:polysaccharide biosynthesis C-terminal domain-containing protein [Stieleria sp. ICT_E10.1]|uniref:polysaccharide biosynthesis C-terminal domain-containing protein n=1 Tax=Stieleria sedimenti TaxID=2976331 RepID=UPI0021806A18|nr:polysaccharide biosynthesis C-terminal domain-containing protein [Stieleria sedimenti]MCS7466771.1 polysaccharide biosynthesis C-terminal domain-containing protein [Stieleria sedimenti]
MNVAKVVLRNVAASWVGLVSQVVVTFFLTPFVIRELGTEAYGVWLLLQGLVGYYGMVDMGLRAGLTQSITRRIAADDVVSVRRHIAAAIPLLSGLAAVIMLAATVLAIVLPSFVEMSGELAASIWTVVLIQAFGAAIKMPVTPYGSVLVGLQRYDIANAVTIFTRIIFAVVTWLALSRGGGLIALSIVLMSTNCLDGLIRVVVARRCLPGIRGCGITLDRTEIREITSVGIWNFLIGISRQFIYFSDTIVVAILFSARAVAPYGIAASLVDYGTKIVIASTKVLFPTMAYLSKQENKESLTMLYVTATRLVIGLSLSILIVGSVWIRPFLALWLGDSADANYLTSEAPLIFAVLSLAFLFVGFQRAGIQLLLAENKLKLVATLMFLEAIINLVGSIIFGNLIGPVGIAIGTLIAASTMGLLFHVPAHAKILHQQCLWLIFQISFRPMIFGCILAASIYGLANLIGQPMTWSQLMLAGGTSGTIVCILAPVLLTAGQISDLRRTLQKRCDSIRKRFKRSSNVSDAAQSH